jgi:hypothetical protein
MSPSGRTPRESRPGEVAGIEARVRAERRARRPLAPLWAQALVGAACGSLAFEIAGAGVARPGPVPAGAAALAVAAFLPWIAELGRPRARASVAIASNLALIAVAAVIGAAARFLGEKGVLVGIVVFPLAFVPRALAAERAHAVALPTGRAGTFSRIVSRAAISSLVTVGIFVVSTGLLKVAEALVPRLGALPRALGPCAGAALALGLAAAGAPNTVAPRAGAAAMPPARPPAAS